MTDAKEGFELIACTTPHRDVEVVELCKDNIVFAELFVRDGRAVLGIFLGPSSPVPVLEMNPDDLITTIARARAKLAEMYPEVVNSKL